MHHEEHLVSCSQARHCAVVSSQEAIIIVIIIIMIIIITSTTAIAIIIMPALLSKLKSLPALHMGHPRLC